MSEANSQRLVGIGVSAGIAVGPALVVERDVAPAFRMCLAPEAVPAEEQRLRGAIEDSRVQLQKIKDRLSEEVGATHAYIFDAQLLMLDDRLLVDRTLELLRDEAINAEWALRRVSERLQALFEEVADDYLRERSTDLEDVVGRIQLNLAGSAPSLGRLPEACVLVTQDLAPSEAAELDWERVRGVVIDAGSPRSHTAILARSRGIPVVIGLREATERIRPGSLVVLDGGSGIVLVDPPDPTLAGYRAAQERERLEERRLQGTRSLPAETRDGVRIHLQANVEFPEEVDTAEEYGAEGIGLFRSEYMLGRSHVFPDEARQVAVYRRLLQAMRPRPVTVRLWDAGPEDLAPGGASSPNPALGERALRLLGRNPGPFREQLRALFRAAPEGNLRIMLPFLSGVRELRAALELIGSVRGELEGAGLATPPLPVGVHLEVPSAALTVDLLAPHVDFFSVGTNDLIQYLLAVDREDPRLESLYEPLHPAVLRTLATIVEQAGSHGRPVSLCGEMAADPVSALLLLGLGVRELSMRPTAIPRIKEAVRRVDARHLEDVAGRCLRLGTAEEIEMLARQELSHVAAEAIP